jgi:methylglutaconyl-CoA hydratase
MHYDAHHQVVTLSLDHLKKSNALNPELIETFITILDDVTALPQAKVCIIESKAKHFCVGADIQWLQQSLENTPEQNHADVRLLANLFQKLYALPLVTIAVVHGATYGGGIGLAACCDFIIAADDAQFCFSEIKLGVMPATIARYVHHKLPLQRMRQLILCGTQFSSQQAQQWGLVDSVVPKSELNEEIKRWVEQLRCYSRSVLSQGKQLLDSLVPVAGDYEHQAIGRLVSMRNHPDGQEGLKAFLEKRAPQWEDNA